MKLWPCLAALAAACSLATEPNLGGMPIHDVRFNGALAFRLDAERTGDSVRVTAEILNAGADSTTMEFGACSFAIRGVGTGGVWDNRLPPNGACVDVGYVLTVAPGETRSRVVYRRAVSDLLASVRPGEYDVSVYTRVSNELRRFPAGTVRL